MQKQNKNLARPNSLSKKAPKTTAKQVQQAKVHQLASVALPAVLAGLLDTALNKKATLRVLERDYRKHLLAAHKSTPLGVSPSNVSPVNCGKQQQGDNRSNQPTD